METYTKDPDAILSYGFNWTEWLNGDTIATSDWLLPSGITEDSASNTTTATQIIISGGTAGTSYVVTNRITTAGGLTEDRSFTLQVRESSVEASAPTDDELAALVEAEIAANPGGIIEYQLKDGRRVRKMSPKELMELRGMIEARENASSQSMFAVLRPTRPTN